MPFFEELPLIHTVLAEAINSDVALVYVGCEVMCMGKVILRCPRCSQQVVVMRPDSLHPSWSFEKPQASEVVVDVIEQVYECKNPSCHTKFTVYWYEPQKLLETM